MSLRPFFSFYGAKWRIAPLYPAPQHDTIVEPFAGSAGYATRYAERRVVLVDADEIICGVWSYLIGARASEIVALPLLGPADCVDDFALPQEARWLIGFWLNKGASVPRRRPSAWMRQGMRPGCFWGEAVRSRIASQVERIRHWRVILGSYEAAPDGSATWFIDPPYAVAGKHYRRRLGPADYQALATWVRDRPGQVIACEAAGAAWLPFDPFVVAKANEGRHGGKRSYEVVYCAGCV